MKDGKPEFKMSILTFWDSLNKIGSKLNCPTILDMEGKGTMEVNLPAKPFWKRDFESMSAF